MYPLLKKNTSLSKPLTDLAPVRLATRGFTLIEMLVVVAIIVTLAAMIFPVFEMANKRAETLSCIYNMGHITAAVLLYAEDYDGFLLPARMGYGPAGTFGTSWDVVLWPYHRVPGLYLCPSDAAAAAASGTVCYKHSYGLNFDLTMLGGYNGSALPLSALESPSRLILFFEIRGSARALGTSVPLYGLDRIEARHHEGANFAFVDGHVKWMRPHATWKDSHDNLWLP